eukprot:1136917-Pelagomonas_calceolata.AAC.4
MASHKTGNERSHISPSTQGHHGFLCSGLCKSLGNVIVSIRKNKCALACICIPEQCHDINQ